jgi:hypothetical protein
MGGDLANVISLLFRLLSKPWGWVVLGILLVGFAWVGIKHSQEELPERAALSQGAGVLDRATQVTHVTWGHTRRISYDLEIRSASGYVVKLTLPERDITETRVITEEQVKSLLGRSIAVLFRDTAGNGREVWELSADGKAIIPYEQTRQRHVRSQAFEAVFAPCLGGGGLVVSLAGIIELFRRRRQRMVAAALRAKFPPPPPPPGRSPASPSPSRRS